MYLNGKLVWQEVFSLQVRIVVFISINDSLFTDFNIAQQLGSAVGISLFTVVQIAVDNKPYNGSTVTEEFIGTAAGDWLVFFNFH